MSPIFLFTSGVIWCYILKGGLIFGGDKNAYEVSVNISLKLWEVLESETSVTF